MEYIYIVENPSFPKMVKIGRTKHLDRRLNELNQITPTQWKLVKSYEVQDSAYAEKFIHQALNNTRVREDREFFSTLGMDIVASVDVLIADADHYYAKRKFKSTAVVKSSADMNNILREVRLAKNISQDRLAELSGVSKATIGRVERGDYDVSATTLLKLLEVLDCELRLGLMVDREKQRRRVRKMYNIHAP